MYELIEKIENVVSEFIKEGEGIEVSAEEIGLDPRSGRAIISISNMWLLTKTPGPMEYYGGLEYCQEKESICGWIIYDGHEESRIRNCIEYYQENRGNENAS
jgi:hypothetical protein